ncbi:C2HC-type zinc finger protein, partial [Aspergillus affinis]|uniref:C2HC-type zinc finger protein n=1 Tax=Aspergillus affinis TaxID=1070780 RepID=UPI0022FE5E43
DPNKARNARRKFNSIRMAAFKDYHTFASEFQYLAVEGRIDRDTWKESFFFALPDEVQRMVAYAFNDDNRTFGDFTYECAKVADLWGDLKKRRNQNTARGSFKSSSWTPNKGASSRLNYVKGEEKDQLMREGKCFICKQFGHLAIDCPQKGSYSSQAPKRELKALEEVPEQSPAEPKNEET